MADPIKITAHRPLPLSTSPTPILGSPGDHLPSPDSYSFEDDMTHATSNSPPMEIGSRSPSFTFAGGIEEDDKQKSDSDDIATPDRQVSTRLTKPIITSKDSF